MLCLVGELAGQAPISLAGKTLAAGVTSGGGPFAGYGYFLLLSATAGNSYEVIGVENVANSIGTYAYSAAGSAGTLNLSDNNVGSIAGSFTFSEPSAGSYSLAAGGFSQAGQFEMYSAPVASTIAGRTFQCSVRDGTFPFAASGSFTLAVSDWGSTYTITGDGMSTVGGSGTCSYSVVNDTTGQIQINNTAVGTATIYVAMSDATTGGYAIRRGLGGFQVGHFTSIGSVGHPSVTITSPTTASTYSTTSSSIDLAGSASDKVTITQVTWDNSRGGSGTANGTTSWSVTGIALQSGVNVVTVTALDSTGQSAFTTLTVQAALDGTRIVAITSPTTASTYSTRSGHIDLAGTASVATTRVEWMNVNWGGNGTANGTTTWSAAGIVLHSGWNAIKVKAYDAAGNSAQAALAVFCDLSVYVPYTFSTLAGSPGSQGAVEGTGSAARFYQPYGVAVDVGANVYVADTYNNTIRKITPTGAVSTFAGSPGVAGSRDGIASTARFWFPQGVVADREGNVYVADSSNSTVRKITADGVVSTLAGLPGESGFADGAGSAAMFNYPQGVAVDSAGNVYVADFGNNMIRKITPDGMVSTMAGSPGNRGNADGAASVALFTGPRGVAVDRAGNVFVAESTIRKITPEGMVSTLAGSPGNSGSADGAGTAAQFQSPMGVAVDDAGNVYVADTSNNTIRKVTPGGMVTTVAGFPGFTGFANGSGRSVRFGIPSTLAVDSAGNIYVADTSNSTIRKGWPFGTGPDADIQIAVSRVGPSTVIHVPTINGCTFQLQASAFLTPPTWTNAGVAQIGYGYPLTFTNSANSTPVSFYRVQFSAP